MGDCDSDAECKSGVFCNFHPNLSKYAVTAGLDPDICEAFRNGCHKDDLGGEDYCSPDCKCKAGEGDCAPLENDCESGLVCWENVGADFGFKSTVDVCLKPTSGCHQGYNGGKNYCSSTCKCGNGEGSCSLYDQCQENHECIPGRGVEFGLPADTYVCIKGLPTCVPRWVCSEDKAHRYWKDGNCNNGPEQYCPGCYRGECRGNICQPEIMCKNGNIVETKSDCQEIVQKCEFGCDNGQTVCKKSLCEPERYCTGKKSLHTKDENCTTRDYSCFEACENGACVCKEESICLSSFTLWKSGDCSVRNPIYCDFGCENGICKTPPSCTPGWICKDSGTKHYKNVDCTYTSLTTCANGCENGQCKQKTCTAGWFCEVGKRGYLNADCSKTMSNDCLYGCDAGGTRCRTEEECIRDGACKPKCQLSQYCDGIKSVTLNQDCTKSEVPCLYGCDSGACKPEQTNIWGWRCKDTSTKGYYLETGEWINTEVCKYGCYAGRCALTKTANCNSYKPGGDGFCSKYCRCGYGLGPCKTDGDCDSGLLCLKDEEIVKAYNLKDGQGICGGFVNSKQLTYTKLLTYFKDDKFDFRMIITSNSQSGIGLFDNLYKNFVIGADTYKMTFKVHSSPDFKDAPLTCKAKWEPHGFDAYLPVLHLNMVLEKGNLGKSNTNVYNGHFTMLVKPKTVKSRYCLVWYITKVKNISDKDMCDIICLSKPEFGKLKLPPGLPVPIPQSVIDQLLLRIGSLDGYKWPQAIPALTAGATAATGTVTMVYVIDSIYNIIINTVVTRGATLGIMPLNIVDIPGYEKISASNQSF